MSSERLPVAVSGFPLEFPFSRIFAEQLEGAEVAPFVVVGMLTPGYAEKAARLVESCRQFRLPHVVYEVPTVHESISARGDADLRFTKANFIHFCLARLKRPVLYVDVDVYFAADPEAIRGLARSGVEFAVYNWLADRQSAAYRPLSVQFGTGASPLTVEGRFYVFSHAIDHFADDQLICSGAVQFWGDTAPAKRLLRMWQETVAGFPHSADDHSLDFAYNNFPSGEPRPRAAWLDKGHARYGFWIHVRPIINHPEVALMSDAFRPIEDSMGRRRWYPERTQLPAAQDVFPRDCMIDVERKLLCRIENGKLSPFARFEYPLWIDPA